MRATRTKLRDLGTRKAEAFPNTAAIVQRLVIRPLRPVSHIVAVLKGLQAGIDVFLHLERRESPPPAPSKGRTGEEDEHLFI